MRHQPVAGGWGDAAQMLGRWLAAYLVVLQVVLSGLALGAMAAPGTSDAFTLCLSAPADGDAGSDHGGSVPAHASHDCIACPLAGGVPVLPLLAGLGAPRNFTTTAVAASADAAPHIPPSVSESARPRAPPQTA